MEYERVDWDKYYMEIAKTVSMRATCMRRRYGAIIVSKDNQIISTGYNGAPRGINDCFLTGSCLRDDLCVPSGQRYELCKSVHAEQNAIIHASRSEMIDAKMYIYGTNMIDDSVANAFPCDICRRMIINAGIDRVYISTSDENCKYSFVRSWDDGIYDNDLFMTSWHDLPIVRYY